MRRAGNLPKFVTKYCVPRYGTSYDAEHRNSEVDHGGNAYGQVAVNVNNRDFQKQSIYTLPDDFASYIVSNLGFIGAPWVGDEAYEEDFRYYRFENGRRGQFLHGSYVNLNNIEKGFVYIPNGKSTLAGGGNTSEWNDRPFLPEQMETVWHEGALKSSLNFTLNVNYMFDKGQSGHLYSRDGRTIGIGAASEGRITGDSIAAANGEYDQVTTMGYNTIIYWQERRNAYNQNRFYLAGFRNGRGASIGGEFYDYRGPAAGSELFGLHSRDNKDSYSFKKVYSMETNQQFSFENADGVEVSMDTVVGRFVLSSLPDSPCIAYVDPYKNYGPENRITVIPFQKNSSNTVITEGNRIAQGTAFLAWESDLYYKDRLPVTEIGGNIMTFGSCYMPVKNRILTDAETGERHDLSGILPEHEESDAKDTGFSSGIYGKMLLYDTLNKASDAPDPIRFYVVTKYAVFAIKVPDDSDPNYDGYYSIHARPSKKHCQKLIVFRDQVIYLISETDFEAYDMQTFLRLDNLPGFKSAVEKMWERPND